MNKRDDYRIEDEVEQILEASVGELARRVREATEEVSEAWPVPHVGDAQQRAYALSQRDLVMRAIVQEMISDWRDSRYAVRESNNMTASSVSRQQARRGGYLTNSRLLGEVIDLGRPENGRDATLGRRHTKQEPRASKGSNKRNGRKGKKHNGNSGRRRHR